MSQSKSQPPSGADRRIDPRHIACVLAHVERDAGATRSAVIRDISVSGALLFTRAHLEAGERVKLSLYLDGDGGTPVNVDAEVLRAGPRPRNMSDVWPYSAAVKFDDALGHLEKKLAAIAEQQAKVFGSELRAVTPAGWALSAGRGSDTTRPLSRSG